MQHFFLLIYINFEFTQFVDVIYTIQFEASTSSWATHKHLTVIVGRWLRRKDIQESHRG